MRAYLRAFGLHLPERIVTNAELAERVGRTAEWIEEVSGIRERRWADAKTAVADMGCAAAEDCLRRAEVKPDSIGMLIVASGSASRGFPGPAAEIAHRLGLSGAPALDVPIASAGSLVAIALAMNLAEDYRNILVIGAEKMSALVEKDRNTAILFGDGAGATLINCDSGRWKLLDSVLHSDGQYRADLAFDGVAPLHMNGLTVILQASRKIPAAIEEVLQRQNLSAGQITAFILHQANLNLLTRVAKALSVSQEKIFTNVQRYGNTSSASMLIAAAEWAETNPAAGPIVFSAFGAGFHWGAVVARAAD